MNLFLVYFIMVTRLHISNVQIFYTIISLNMMSNENAYAHGTYMTFILVYT